MSRRRVVDLRLSDIPAGEARVTTVDGADVALFRSRSGQVHALDARCPHRGGPLADGLCDADVVVCPLHGRTFDLRTGTEVHGDYAVRSWRAQVHTDGTISVEPRLERDSEPLPQ